jgi:hypothetical protein
MAGLPAYPGKVDTAEGHYLRQLSQLPILNGYLTTVTFSATDTVTQRHSLGRAYRGCLVIASTVPTSTPAITALDPETASRSGTDITKYITISAEASWSGTVTVWIL